ncbi:hypothetical protein [Ruminococcus sp.]|nr:hypothetical protein [Ruminococcus sp.]MBQ8965403.1 hypothetical protein [Ruminococcus sp.]
MKNSLKEKLRRLAGYLSNTGSYPAQVAEKAAERRKKRVRKTPQDNDKSK